MAKQITITDVAEHNIELSLHELCLRIGCNAEYVLELLEYSVIEPSPKGPPSSSELYFSCQALYRVKRALRLQRDLGINMQGLAVALDLLDEINDLRNEVKRLERNLARYQ